MAFVTNGKGCAIRKFGPYSSHKQYCERLRLIMIQHLPKVGGKYHDFFVVNQEAELKDQPPPETQAQPQLIRSDGHFKPEFSLPGRKFE